MKYFCIGMIGMYIVGYFVCIIIYFRQAAKEGLLDPYSYPNPLLWRIIFPIVGLFILSASVTPLPILLVLLSKPIKMVANW